MDYSGTMPSARGKAEAAFNHPAVPKDYHSLQTAFSLQRGSTEELQGVLESPTAQDWEKNFARELLTAKAPASAASRAAAPAAGPASAALAPAAAPAAAGRATFTPRESPRMVREPSVILGDVGPEVAVQPAAAASPDLRARLAARRAAAAPAGEAVQPSAGPDLRSRLAASRASAAAPAAGSAGPAAQALAPQVPATRPAQAAANDARIEAQMRARAERRAAREADLAQRAEAAKLRPEAFEAAYGSPGAPATAARPALAPGLEADLAAMERADLRRPAVSSPSSAAAPTSAGTPGALSALEELESADRFGKMSPEQLIELQGLQAADARYVNRRLDAATAPAVAQAAAPRTPAQRRAAADAMFPHGPANAEQMALYEQMLKKGSLQKFAQFGDLSMLKAAAQHMALTQFGLSFMSPVTSFQFRS